MPLLDIATVQPSLQNHLVPVCSQTFIHGQVLSSPWKSSQFSRRVEFHPRHLEKQGSCQLRIRAAALTTLELKSSVQKEDGSGNSMLAVHSSPLSTQIESLKEDWVDLDERERLRRMRISKANKGNIPWNKGRKHSAETCNRIRERTRIAMQNPKIKLKRVNLGRAQSVETRLKIGIGVRMGWERRREKIMMQETCYFGWQNLIAESSRKGFLGEEELQWDSYKILDEQLKKEWLESVERRKSMPRPKGSKRAPKSPEQRKKIAAAIAAKWADPAYRERVCSGLAKYHGLTDGAERKPKKKPSGGTQPRRKSLTTKKFSDTDDSSRIDTKTLTEGKRSRKRNAPLYKDPMPSSKLDMIKNIRAQRAAAESKKTEAIERARLLIAEAEKAAEALEIAAVKSPVAPAYLVETRKLIAEAIQSIESIEGAEVTSNEIGKHLSVNSAELTTEVDKEIGSEDGGLIQAEQKEVNGRQTLPVSKNEDFSFASFTLARIVNDEEKFMLPSSSNHVLSALNLEDLVKLPDSSEQLAQFEPNGIDKPEKTNGINLQVKEDDIPSKPVTVTKKWVRGRLVDVSEEAS
ncbi:hypothetical protein SLEP1_g21146 [Rubroshorea leprosula]|uniref:Nuclease associated modular domain-containing protein n=1 Tax=Rubroshorea leprosula TaxID=152421 RepID=A0AAV5J509_9ROSI|nr:hypothetical protein SLEP1_g21146 [Rubroshorea leprosula]